MGISDWSSDVCSSDLASMTRGAQQPPQSRREQAIALIVGDDLRIVVYAPGREALRERGRLRQRMAAAGGGDRTGQVVVEVRVHRPRQMAARERRRAVCRSEEHTSELQSLMRISYAVFCLKQKKIT